MNSKPKKCTFLFILHYLLLHSKVKNDRMFFKYNKEIKKMEYVYMQ